MNDSSAIITPSTSRRLVRQQTPHPSYFESSSDEDNALKIQTASNTAMNRNMLGMNKTLFWNLASQQDDNNDSESESESDSDNENNKNKNNDDSSSSSDDDNDDQETRPEGEDDHDGRERDSSIMDLSNNSLSVSGPSSSFSSSWSTATDACSLDTSPSLAIQADKKFKRVRLDPSAIVSSKKVRFDESKNTVH
ncbi:hypothetical protein BGZ65_011316, partial [Modicella reniformis]